MNFSYFSIVVLFLNIPTSSSSTPTGKEDIEFEKDALNVVSWNLHTPHFEPFKLKYHNNEEVKSFVLEVEGWINANKDMPIADTEFRAVVPFLQRFAVSGRLESEHAFASAWKELGGMTLGAFFLHNTNGTASSVSYLLEKTSEISAADRPSITNCGRAPRHTSFLFGLRSFYLGVTANHAVVDGRWNFREIFASKTWLVDWADVLIKYFSSKIRRSDGNFLSEIFINFSRNEKNDLIDWQKNSLLSSQLLIMTFWDFAMLSAIKPHYEIWLGLRDRLCQSYEEKKLREIEEARERFTSLKATVDVLIIQDIDIRMASETNFYTQLIREVFPDDFFFLMQENSVENFQKFSRNSMILLRKTKFMDPHEGGQAKPFKFRHTSLRSSRSLLYSVNRIISDKSIKKVLIGSYVTDGRGVDDVYGNFVEYFYSLNTLAATEEAEVIIGADFGKKMDLSLSPFFEHVRLARSRPSSVAFSFQRTMLQADLELASMYDERISEESRMHVPFRVLVYRGCKSVVEHTSFTQSWVAESFNFLPLEDFPLRYPNVQMTMTF